MGSHSSQATEAAAPKPVRDACKSGKSLLGRWNQAKSRVQDQPLQSDLFGGLSPILRKAGAGRGWRGLGPSPAGKVPTGVGSSLRCLEAGGPGGLSLNLQHRCAVKEQGEGEQDCDKSG